MKNYVLIFLAIATFCACNNSGDSKKSSSSDQVESSVVQADPAKVKTVELSVSGMTCGGCENTVTKAVKKLDGIASVEASHQEANTIVSFDTSLVSVEQIRNAIDESGFEVEN